MSRISTLLSAALEEHIPMAEGPYDSLENYMDLRVAMEEFAAVSAVQDQLEGLSETLTQVETTVDAARTKDELDDAQVGLQVHAVNTVRNYLDGDVSITLSTESFGTALDASLEASAQSKGMLKRMWDAFIALLKAARDAFVKVWRWVVGLKIRATNNNKTMRDDVSEIKDTVKDIEATADDSDDRGEAGVPADVKKNLVTPEVIKVKEEADVVKGNIPKAKEAVKEIARVTLSAEEIVDQWFKKGYGTGSNPSYISLAREYKVIDDVLDGVTAAAKAEALSEDDMVKLYYPRGKHRPGAIVDAVTSIAEAWLQYPELAGDITNTLDKINTILEKLEKVAVAGAKGDDYDGSFAEDAHDIRKGLEQSKAKLVKLGMELDRSSNKSTKTITKVKGKAKQIKADSQGVVKGKGRRRRR